MDHKQGINSQGTSDSVDLPAPPRDMTKPDPVNPAPVPRPETDAGRPERPDLEWAEHED